MGVEAVKTGICKNTIEALEVALDLAKRGEIRNIALVADNTNGNYYTIHGYDDVGIILGRLQLAMLDIHARRTV